MTHENLDWTHRHIKFTDIRKLNKLYVVSIDSEKKYKPEVIDQPLFIKDTIFEERLKSYLLKPINEIRRDEILGLNWNMYITKGYYIKIDQNGFITKFNHDPNKWYVSYLEIEGVLGTFSSIYRDKDINKEIN